MKKIFLLFFSTSIFVVNAQKPVTTAVSSQKNKMQNVLADEKKMATQNLGIQKPAPKAANANDTIITKDANDLSLSHYVVKNANGGILVQGKLVKGMKEGLWRFYYDFGAPQKMEEYHLGKKNGIAVTYDRSGFIQFDETYKNDELDGISLKYINGGKVKSQIEYKNGKLDGRKLLNYDDGTHQEESYWKNGIKNGITKWYYQKNVVMMESNYKDGKLNGLSNTYNNSGKLIKTGLNINDKEDGVWQEYDDNGNVIKFTIYKNGVVINERNIEQPVNVKIDSLNMPK